MYRCLVSSNFSAVHTRVTVIPICTKKLNKKELTATVHWENASEVFQNLYKYGPLDLFEAPRRKRALHILEDQDARCVHK